MTLAIILSLINYSECVDVVLYEWFTKPSEGAPISGPTIIEKAKEFYEKMELKEECTFSDGWLAGFKNRHGIRKLDITGKKKSACHEAADEYVQKFRDIVKENNLTGEQIYNADETGLL